MTARITSTPPAPGASAGTWAAPLVGNIDDIITAVNGLGTAADVNLTTLLGLPTAYANSTVYTAGQLVKLPTGGLGFRTAAGTSRSSFDATERALWTFLPGGHYEKLTASGNWVCPTGIAHATFQLSGGGGGGGGGGSATTTSGQNLQTGGGGGGGAGQVRFDETALVAGTGYAYTHGAGGTGGAGGAANSNPGSNGNDGNDASFVGVSATRTAKGGGHGLGSAANSTTAVAGGLVGYPTGTTPLTQIVPGCGSASAIGCLWLGTIVGGAGAGPCTASFGGVGGGAATSIGQLIANPTGNAGVPSGTAGTTATVDGCGGGGGGGGSKNTAGAGAAGGAGADGSLKAWF